MRIKTAILTVMLFASVARPALSGEKPPAVGEKAPAFTLLSQEGKPVSLNGFRGRWVVLYFYPKDFTKGCTIEAHGFERDLAEFENKKAVVIGVSVQSADSHKEFCAKEGLNFKLLADTDYKVSSTYGSLKDMGLVKFSARRTFLIDPGGVIREEFLDVKPDGHSEEVLAALARLQASKASSRAPRP